MKLAILATAFPFFIIGLVLLVSPDISYAQAGGLVPCDGPECNACHVAQLAEKVINFVVQTSFVFAALLFAYAGFLYFTGGADPGKRGTANKIFTNTFVGIIIVLTAWLLVNVILTTLTGQGVNPFTKVLCEVDTQNYITPRPSGSSSGGIQASGASKVVPLTSPGSSATSYELTSVPPNRFCSDVKGKDWINVDAKFCGEGAPGSSCCGFFGSSDKSRITLGTQSFDKGDTQGVQNYIKQCRTQDGRISANCIQSSFDGTDEICEKTEYSCI